MMEGTEALHVAVVTGGTGFLGSHFLLKFVGERISHGYALVRGETVDARLEKLRRALEEANSSYLVRRDVDAVIDRLTVLNGDIRRPLAGINEADLAAMRSDPPSEVWHFAASLNFEERRIFEIEAANLEGVRQIFQLATSQGMSRLFHCSTAYTCGTRGGKVEAVQHPGEGPFSNHYERTKCAGENFLLSNCLTHDIELTILRPSVVIGNSETKRSGGTKSGMYGFLRELYQVRALIKKADAPVRVFALTDASVNFIPVDQLMNQVRQLLRQEKHGGIYHLVTTDSPPNCDLLGAINSALGIQSRLVIQDTPVVRSTPLERMLDGRVEFYRSYFRTDRDLVQSVGEPYTILLSDMQLFVREGVKEFMSSDIGSVFDCRTVVASDGARLNVYSNGAEDSPVVLVCNAAGMPAEFTRPLAERLGTTCRVVTWESRELPSFYPNPGELSHTLDRQVLDGVNVLDYFGSSKAVVLGWCAGARLALRIPSLWRGVTIGLVLMNGGYNFDPEEYTPFERNMARSMPLIAKSPEYAKAFYKSIFETASGPSTLELSGNASAPPSGLADIAYTANADDIHLASLPFQSAENLYTYAKLMSAYIASPLDPSDLPDAPCLVMTCEQDLTANPSASRRLAEAMPNAKLAVMEHGDHFSLYWDEAYIDLVEQFVRALQQSSGDFARSGYTK